MTTDYSKRNVALFECFPVLLSFHFHKPRCPFLYLFHSHFLYHHSSSKEHFTLLIRLRNSTLTSVQDGYNGAREKFN